ncbi:cation-translocating P-type ATPase [Palleronia pontilimi]|uniref:cation-translocating P-type ATPase n=1 Tax=Palleronia pontilimi TaxID=1964209 RepID=UPI0034D011BD
MPDHSLEHPFSLSVEDVIRKLKTDADNGLDPGEAEARLGSYCANRLRRQKRKSLLAILGNLFQSAIVWLLTFAAGLSFVFGEFAEGVAIVALLLVNAGIGFFTELRAARSMEALMQIADVRTRVRRGGESRMIDARDIVPGDIVVLEVGDMVTADLRLIEAAKLQMDEAVLTGESTPVEKATEPVAKDTAVGDRADMAFKGTAVTQGSGEGLVVATGMDTEIGRISYLAQSAEADVTPLEQRLDRLGHRLVWLSLGLAALAIGAGILRGSDIMAMIQTGVALAVASVPEGLPIVATLSLARGMWRMSARNALITQLSSVETLGATTVILTDKTGTLTENRMTVAKYIFEDAEVEVDADGDHGFRNTAGDPVSPDEDTRLAAALRIGALCSAAETGDETDRDHAGDPMEIALLAVAKTASLAQEDLVSDLPEIREHAFDPDVKMMATVHEDDGAYLVAVKGAPEEDLQACSRVLKSCGETGQLDDDTRSSWLDRNANAAQDGLRVLALAQKRVSDGETDPYDDLDLIGLVCLIDPIRDDVPEAIAARQNAWVRVVMLTGDHADTARTIAKKAGLGDGELKVLEGPDLGKLDVETMSEDDLAQVMQTDVFARVAPETKLTLVSLFQKAGQVVAMTGDGVNDAPALKKADIGIAMGQRGTEVAKEAARMVLQDDRFPTIVAAMREGRVIFGNIRNFAIYMMSCNVSQILVVGLAVGAGLPTPLLPLQILYLNVVTGSFLPWPLASGPEAKQC